jgi:hypothetical protein
MRYWRITTPIVVASMALLSCNEVSSTTTTRPADEIEDIARVPTRPGGVVASGTDSVRFVFEPPPPNSSSIRVFLRPPGGSYRFVGTIAPPPPGPIEIILPATVEGFYRVHIDIVDAAGRLLAWSSIPGMDVSIYRDTIRDSGQVATLTPPFGAVP